MLLFEDKSRLLSLPEPSFSFPLPLIENKGKKGKLGREKKKKAVMGVFLDKAYFSFSFLEMPPLLSTLVALLGNVIHIGKKHFYFTHSCLEGPC